MTDPECPLCELPLSQCAHGPAAQRGAAHRDGVPIVISPQGVAHFEGCPHKGDDPDMSRWAELATPRAWERLGRREHLRATGDKNPELVAISRCSTCDSHGPW